MTNRMKTILICCVCLGADSWFGDDIVEALLQQPAEKVEIEMPGRKNFILSKIEPHMQEIYAPLEPTPEKYERSEAMFEAVPHKDRIECLVSVPPSKEIVARVNVWNDGRVEGGWNEELRSN